MPAVGIEPMTRKQQEFAKRENQILQAALGLFENPHWEQVTVEQIARKADIGKGTVYKHFTCKEEIYAHITISFTQKLLEAFQLATQNGEVLDKLKEIIRIAFNMFINHTAEARVSFYCKRVDYRERLNEQLKCAFEALDDEFDALIGELLQSGIDSGLFPNRPIEQLMMGLEATFDGAISMIWNGDISYQQAEDQENYVNIISEYMLAGLVGLKHANAGENCIA